MDKWSNKPIKLKDKVKMRGGGQNISHFYGFYMRESKKERHRTKDFFRQSTKFCRLEFVGPRTKVHCLDEGYACVPKRRDFTEDPKEEIWGNPSFQV